MRSSLGPRVLLVLVAGAAIFVGSGRRVIADQGRSPDVGILLLSRSTYSGTASTVKVGEDLPPGTIITPIATATNDGSFPGVFLNAEVDGSFGVTSPIFVDRYDIDGHSSSLDWRSTLNIPTNQMVTSFSSKSELGLFPRLTGRRSHSRVMSRRSMRRCFQLQHAEPCRRHQSGSLLHSARSGPDRRRRAIFHDRDSGQRVQR